MSAYGLPINPDVGPGETSVNIYGYTPWLALGIVSIVIFGIALIAHISYAIIAGLQGRRGRREKADSHAGDTSISAVERSGHIVTFETLFSFGCAMEVVGYGFRTASSTNPFILTSFVLNYFMIVVAPVFFSAAIYYCLSMILRSRRSYAALLPLSGKAIVGIFVTADVITIVTQVVGAAMIGVSQSKLADGEVPPITAEQANDILRAGLAVQVFSLTIFLSLLTVLVVRISKHRRSATAESMDTPATSTTMVSPSGKSRIPLLLTVLTLSTVFIYIRTVFRLIEAAMGVESSATLNQGLFTALETVPVYVAVILWTVFPLHVLF